MNQATLAVFRQESETDAVLDGLPLAIPTPIGINAFLRQEFPERKLLLAPWLPQQGLVMLHAARGVGKTFFSLGIALSIAAGRDFLGWKAQKSRVLYIDGEMSAADMQERMKRLISGMNLPQISDENFRLLTPDLMPSEIANLNFGDPYHLAALSPHLAQSDLIFVDNLSCLYPFGDENEAQSWLPMQDWLLTQKRSGRSVLLIHHSGKNGGQRGTSKREDIVDTVVSLKAGRPSFGIRSPTVQVTFEKSRGFSPEDAQPLLVTLTEIENQLSWVIENNKEDRKARCLELLQQGHKQSEIAKLLKVNRSSVSRWIASSK